jgi:hypothetical protein
MLKHGFPKPNFKGFMVDSAQANYNAIKIVYGYGDVFVKMVDKECTCLFHWIQLFNRHNWENTALVYIQQCLRTTFVLSKNLHYINNTYKVVHLVMGLIGMNYY